MDYLMPYVRLAPNGDFALKSDEWQQLNLNVEILNRSEPRGDLPRRSPVRIS
jgi:hypothetical protein